VERRGICVRVGSRTAIPRRVARMSSLVTIVSELSRSASFLEQNNMIIQITSSLAGVQVIRLDIGNWLRCSSFFAYFSFAERPVFFRLFPKR
jgi:hypothetical protein